MIAALNRIVELVEERLTEDPPVADVARSHGTTEYHVRRMFSSLAAMPLSEYVRRRRMTVAAADVLGQEAFLDIAVRYGYSSAEAFGRAFHAVHGVNPGEVRRNGGPLRSQATLRFRVAVEGTAAVRVRIVERPAFRLVGHAVRVPLVHRGANPQIAAHIAAIPAPEHARLASMSEVEPAGLLQVSDDVHPDYLEGSELTYLHGVAVGASTPVPADLDALEVSAGEWAVFRASGAYPASLQATWAATATDWFPATPWRLRPGPSIVAILDRADDFSTADCELWLPVERS